MSQVKQMIVQRSEKQIRFKFEPKDWQIRDRQACQDFISRIQPFVCAPWDPKTKFWTIDRRGEGLFEQLRDELFRDKNQSGLF